jgi:hypothetical protein
LRVCAALQRRREWRTRACLLRALLCWAPFCECGVERERERGRLLISKLEDGAAGGDVCALESAGMLLVCRNGWHSRGEERFFGHRGSSVWGLSLVVHLHISILPLGFKESSYYWEQVFVQVLNYLVPRPSLTLDDCACLLRYNSDCIPISPTLDTAATSKTLYVV